MSRKILLATAALAGTLLGIGALCSRSEASEPAAGVAAPAAPPAGGVVTGAQAQALQQGGALVLDVRTPAEFAAGHVPGAVNVPFDELDRRAAELPADRDAALVIYCRTGRRSGIAADTLRRLGYSRVFDFQRATDWPGPLAR